MTFIRIIIIYKTTFIRIIAVCTRWCIIWHSIILCTYVTITYIHGVGSCFLPISPCSPCSPCCSLSNPPLYPFSTYLAPSSCDRNCPPSPQVACKLTLSAPPFTQLSHPLQIPRTPTARRLTTTILGPLRSDYAEHYRLISLLTPINFCWTIHLILTYSFFMYISHF